MVNKDEPGETRSDDRRFTAEATEILDGASKKSGLARLLPFLGPAFIASVAYVDPGNFATNIAGGAQFGYLLLWVIVASNLMAMLIQALSAKLGIASGHNLAEHCRNNFPRPMVYFMWGLMEVVAMATDLAEFLGAALGFNLLLGIPLWWAAILTGIATFLILGLERYGFRPLEAVITSFVGVIALSYVVEIILVRPDWGAIAFHSCSSTILRKRQYSTGDRYPGRHGDAARHLPPFGFDPGAHHGAPASPVEEALPL